MKTKKVIVLPYDEAWISEFEKIKAEIEGALGDLILRAEHVGSTSVKGLSAQPCIDIDVVIEDYSVLRDVVKKLADIGYIHEGDLGIEGREAFKYSGYPFQSEPGQIVVNALSFSFLLYTFLFILKLFLLIDFQAIIISRFYEFFKIFYLKNTIRSVPTTIRQRPAKAFFESFSLKTKYEKITVTIILSLSIGTTTLTSPF